MQGRTWTKRDSFAHFGAKSKNQVWSWSAISPDRKTIVITIWDDHIKSAGDGWVVSNFGQESLPRWQNLPGNRERIEYLKAARDNCDGLFRVVRVFAVDNTVIPRKIARCYPDDELLMRLTKLDETTGEFEAVSVPPNPSHAEIPAAMAKTTPSGSDKDHEASVAFGYRAVAAADKQKLVNDVFSHVAERYDQMNDLLSGGLHRLWKDDVVALLNPPRTGRTFRVLDVAGGTGDVAFRILRAGGAGTSVVIADISPAMMAEGRVRAQHEGLRARCRFAGANAEALPFGDRSFEGYTIAFGIRNVTHVEVALAEAFRVLKPGGRFVCLEFSDVDVPGLDALYDAYSFTVMPAVGHVVTGEGAAYRYLAESIRMFPCAAEFARMIADAGFSRVATRKLAGGIVAIHSAWRL